MVFKEQYENRFQRDILENPVLCEKNKQLFKDFFTFQERKLKRINQLSSLDEGTYHTLLSYITRLLNVDEWFKHKAWVDLTKEDIKQVYDDLEDGIIKKQDGTRFEDRQCTYYNKIFKSKPFELAGKAEFAREIIETPINREENVRFFEEETLKSMVDVTNKISHKALLWLAWDIGENINSLLKLKKKDFDEQKNPDTKEDEYLIRLPKEILKRSRKPRSEITLHQETVRYLKMILKDLKDEDLIFGFQYRTAKVILSRIVDRVKAKCKPNNDKVTWKDFRSSMACYLLSHEWTTDEVNGRLGHKPSSREIDKYVTFLALDRHKPKKRLFDTNIDDLKKEVEESKKREKMLAQRIEEMKESFADFIVKEKKLKKENVEKNIQKRKARKILKILI
jgi:hypothetical protein